jgi:hypothetical protein
MAKQRPTTEQTAQEQTSTATTDSTQESQVGSTSTTDLQQPEQDNTTNGSSTESGVQETGTSKENTTADSSVDNGQQQVIQTAEVKTDSSLQSTVEQKTEDQVKVETPAVQEKAAEDTSTIVATSTVAAPASINLTNVEVSIPADIADEVHPDMVKFLEHYSQTASPSSKAWARNLLNTSIRFKRKRPIDMKGCLDCTMFALTSMQQSIAFAEEAQVRMRFIKACFLYINTVFDLELIGRGANQLTEQQYKQYMALSNMFHYWATLNDGAEVLKRYNVTKELTGAFEPAFAQRAASIIGA